jgi:hypothetical protein
MLKKPKIMKKLNELNACAAFITILKSLTDIKYLMSESPDELNRSTPDVDFVVVSSSDEKDKIAVEHTIVESFDEQISQVAHSSPRVAHSTLLSLSGAVAVALHASRGA